MATRQSHLTVTFAVAASLLGAACNGPPDGNDSVARNCHFAIEGKKLFEKYSRVLRVAKDWERVGWLRQVPVTKWMACKHNLGSHAPIDDCLDKFAYDPNYRDLPINTAIDRCVERAKKRLAR